MSKLRIHGSACRRQYLQSDRRLKTAIHQHAARGPRSLMARFAAFHHENTCPFLSKSNRQRQPDDSAADHDHIAGLHSSIVKKDGIGHRKSELIVLTVFQYIE